MTQWWLNPEWEKAGEVHEWRNHVPSGVKAMWNTFTEAQQQALYEWADHLAGLELWE